MANNQTKKKKRSRLELSTFKLQSLLEITNAINNNLSTSKLLELFKIIIKEQLNIGRAILFSFDSERWICILRYGSKGTERAFNPKEDLLHLKEITLIESSSKSHLSRFDVVIPVYHKNQPLAYLLLGDLDEQELRISPIIKHLPFIQTITNIIVVAVENKRLARDHIKQERIKKELELASEMQFMLFPSNLPDNEFLQVSAYYQPHHQVGGDYYDFITLNDEEILFAMADVSGKGVSAALLMSNFQANLRAIVQYKGSLREIIRELNKKVMGSANGEKYITLFIARYNKNTRVLNYINAAHNPPMLMNGDSVVMLETGCTGLGMFEKVPKLSEGAVIVIPGSMLLCYTDGVTELENPEGIPFDVNRLQKVVADSKNESMEQVNENIMAALNKHSNGKSPHDDIALLAIRFH